MMQKAIKNARSKEELGDLPKMIDSLFAKSNLNKDTAKELKGHLVRIFRSEFMKASRQIEMNTKFFEKKAKPFAEEKAKRAGLDKAATKELVAWIKERCFRMRDSSERKTYRLYGLRSKIDDLKRSSGGAAKKI